MRLTKFTDLALRVTMRLAAIDEGTAPTSREVAESVSASYTHIARPRRGWEFADIRSRPCTP